MLVDSSQRGWALASLAIFAASLLLYVSYAWSAAQGPQGGSAIGLLFGIVGFGFMQHGFAKLSKGPDAFAAILQAMGVPGPHFMAWLTILVELLGGFAVILGAFVTLVSLPMIVVLLVAMFTVHLPYGFSSIKLLAVSAAGARFGPPGYELDLLYIACLAALILGGSGPMAVDGLIGKQKETNLR